MSCPRLRRLFAPLAAAGLIGAHCPPARAQDEPTREVRVDPDAYPPPSTRLPLLATGAAVTGGFYGAALGASYMWPDARGAADLRIPVVGPWMKLFQTGCADSAPNCNQFLLVLGAVLVGLDGLGQAGGVGLLLEGIFLRTASPSATTMAPPTSHGTLRLNTGAAVVDGPARSTSRSFAWHPVPLMTGEDGVGVGVVGTF